MEAKIMTSMWMIWCRSITEARTSEGLKARAQQTARKQEAEDEFMAIVMEAFRAGIDKSRILLRFLGPGLISLPTHPTLTGIKETITNK